MERHFILPLTIAAVFHGGLLFGIRGGPAALIPDNLKPNVVDGRRVPIEIVPPPPEPDEAVHSGGATEDRAPTRPEPPPDPHRDGITIEIPPREPISNDSLRKIPEGPFGPPGPTLDSFPPGPAVVFLGGELDAPPHARLQVAPVYPFEAKNTGREGEVLVEFTVDESGVVVAPRVLRSSDRSFEEPTLRAVSRWRFEPGRRDGKVVRFRMSVPVVFNLNEN